MASEGMLLPLTNDLRDTVIKVIRQTLDVADSATLWVYELTLTRTKHGWYHVRAKCRIGNDANPWFNIKFYTKDI